MDLDFSDFRSVRQASQTTNARVSPGNIPPITLFILSAGYQDFGKQVWTPDSFDKTFSANYLGHRLLTLCLMRSMDKEPGRIVVIGSQAHDGPGDKRNDPTRAFADERYKTTIQDKGSIDAIAKGTWSLAKEDPILAKRAPTLWCS
ncbi:hypothetical protein F5Y16DRAFT_371068 [Xylariaceae sp. FL0255]|nr:hypothetical protein F5Y16DRAFT_371068 [Xylariaceae sp. FL0255]